MAGGDSTSGGHVRWRSVLEIGLLSAVIYIVLGAPGFPTTTLFSSGSGTSSTSADLKVPQARAKIESLVSPSSDLQCPQHRFRGVHIFSTDPLVIYIDGFLTDQEADHLVDISADKWTPSTVFNAGVEVRDDSVRRSDKALIDRDNVVQCIEARALALQGWPASTYIERLWTQRYNISGHYALHYDWAASTKTSRRVSTFMVYVRADCEGGGTRFPMLPVAQDGKWCEFLDCTAAAGDGEGSGVTFKARQGAAVFWRNFDDDGRGYKETIHAGMPVAKGVKVGLNIWSWYQQ